jgi:hypothetical protein
VRERAIEYYRTNRAEIEGLLDEAVEGVRSTYRHFPADVPADVVKPFQFAAIIEGLQEDPEKAAILGALAITRLAQWPSAAARAES